MYRCCTAFLDCLCHCRCSRTARAKARDEQLTQRARPIALHICSSFLRQLYNLDAHLNSTDICDQHIEGCDNFGTILTAVKTMLAAGNTIDSASCAEEIYKRTLTAQSRNIGGLVSLIPQTTPAQNIRAALGLITEKSPNLATREEPLSAPHEAIFMTQATDETPLLA